MQQLVAEAGLSETITIDSAGTGDWHIGHAPHGGTRGELAAHGIADDHMRARQVTLADLETFDYVLAMDRTNLADLKLLGGHVPVACDLSLLLTHAEDPAVSALADVPDPYYVGGFDRVYDLVHAGCTGLMHDLVATHRLAAY